MKTSVCDAPQELTMTLNIPKINSTDPKYTYIEYTDPFGKKWYSKRIELQVSHDSQVYKYGEKEITDLDKNIIDWTTATSDQFKWCYVFVDFLYTLPPGTIDLKDTKFTYDNGKITSGCGKDSNNGIEIEATSFTVTLNFGDDQTGDQSGIRLVTAEDKVENGVVDVKNLITNNGDEIVAISNAVTPTICSGFGKCNTETGKCECYKDLYYGYACNLPKSIS